jgi:hypothetical protein
MLVHNIYVCDVIGLRLVVSDKPEIKTESTMIFSHSLIDYTSS